MDKKNFLPLITLFVSVLAIVVWFQFHEATRREILAMELETRRLRTLEQEISALKARHDDSAEA